MRQYLPLRYLPFSLFLSLSGQKFNCCSPRARRSMVADIGVFKLVDSLNHRQYKQTIKYTEPWIRVFSKFDPIFYVHIANPDQ